MLLIREVISVLKNFLSECSGFILCKCKESSIIVLLSLVLSKLRAGTFLDVSIFLLSCVMTLPREQMSSLFSLA